MTFICGSNEGSGGYCEEPESAASGRRLEGSALPKLTWPEGTVAERLSGLERDLRAIKDHLGVTHSPTSSPTSNTSTASYDTVLKAPKCGVVHSTGICTTLPAELLIAKKHSGEPNGPNTIDGCEDGTLGIHKMDKNIEAITVTSSKGVLTW